VQASKMFLAQPGIDDVEGFVAVCQSRTNVRTTSVAGAASNAGASMFEEPCTVLAHLKSKLISVASLRSNSHGEFAAYRQRNSCDELLTRLEDCKMIGVAYEHASEDSQCQKTVEVRTLLGTSGSDEGYI
jgi:hypothetical protein